MKNKNLIVLLIVRNKYVHKKLNLDTRQPPNEQNGSISAITHLHKNKITHRIKEVVCQQQEQK